MLAGLPGSAEETGSAASSLRAGAAVCLRAFVGCASAAEHMAQCVPKVAQQCIDTILHPEGNATSPVKYPLRDRCVDMTDCRVRGRGRGRVRLIGEKRVHGNMSLCTCDRK
jgi:hypothetical protein